MSIMMVQHNAEAMFANRELKVTTGLKAKSSERLASGYRINRAADDAAGLSISEKLRWQVRGLDKASTNIQDGISFLQTGEGALNEVHDMLNRIKELSIQASNDTNTDTDRNAINEEVQQIKKEMNRIFNDTEFNTIKIFRAPYIPDIENTPDDYKMFNLGNSSTVGGLMINNRRYTWDELGVDNSENDWEKKFTDDNGELIWLKLDKGADYSSMRRVYEMDADSTGIKINNLYAGKWDDTIEQDGDEYKFSWHGMDFTITAGEGDERDDVIAHIKKETTSSITWNAVPAGLSGSSAVSSTADTMTFNVTNTNKNNIEQKSYKIEADEQGVWVSEYNGANGTTTAGNKVKWSEFDDANGDYEMRDWGTSNDASHPVANDGNNGSNPVTLDDSAKYHFTDTKAWDGITSNKMEFDFRYLKDEVSLAEAINGVKQNITGAAVNAPIKSVTSGNNKVDPTGYSNINFHFQRDQLLRDFGTGGSDAPMSLTVERTRVFDGYVYDYEKRNQLSEAYVKNTEAVTTTVTETYGSATRKYYLGDDEITAESDAALYAALQAGTVNGIATHNAGDEVAPNSVTTTYTDTYLANTGQSPATVADTSNDVAGTQRTEIGTIDYVVNEETGETVTYKVIDTYDTNINTTVHTVNTFDGKNYYKDGTSYIESAETDLYVEDSDTSNEVRDMNGMRYKAETGNGQRYVKTGEGYAQNKRYELCHYEYAGKNSSGTTVVTGKSNQFIDTSSNIVDSELDAGNWTTGLSAENKTYTKEITNANGSKTGYTTNLAQRTTTLSGKNVDNFTSTITLNYNDTADTSGTGNASVGLTITPNGNATRTYTKAAQTAGSASETNLKVKIDPPEKTLNIQAGALGLQGIEIKWTALSNSIIGMGGVKTTSYGTSQAALSATDDAIDMISTVRSGFGAQQNRLEHAYAIDRIIQENTDTAESRIRDTDMARETVIYSKYRLLEQVGQTLLAQANQNKMGILNLLQ